MLREFKDKTSHYFSDDTGLLQGEYKKWYIKKWWKKRQLYFHCFYVNGKKHGKYVDQHENGKLWETSFYINGERHGERKIWHENGKLRSHHFWVNGYVHGEFKEWYDNGEVCIHCFYVNGKYTAFSKLPYPITPEERMLFMLKYDLQLLPAESVC